MTPKRNIHGFKRMSFVVVTLYHFFDFPDYVATKPALQAELARLEIKGTLQIATEGINGTLAGTRESTESFLTYLETMIVKAPFESKESLCDRMPFARTKVRLKKEIISLGEPVHPKSLTGQYVDAGDWNELIADPDTTVIDARNHYEVHLGTFPGAIDPGTRTFKQLPPFIKHHLDPAQHKRVATFCTGGIRCEKFSSWLLEQGFEEVYQLKGGILKYLEDVPEDQSMWQGECYVFDERVAVTHGLAPSQSSTMCPGCGHALTVEDRAHAYFNKNLTCPFCPTG